MLSIHEIEEYFSDTDPALLEIVLELRNVIFEIAPQATEMIQWKGISYFNAERGGTVSGGICQVHVIEGRVRLGSSTARFCATRNTCSPAPARPSAISRSRNTNQRLGKTSRR